MQEGESGSIKQAVTGQATTLLALIMVCERLEATGLLLP